ncbi:MAG: BolA/IbaG family iron-sulfur metabolism protein [Gammaproteobacteria bacterium]|nr:BolA/IbaG family iron-sulfur metabolism protein [Gammaproteobacteria bacterium]MBP6053296.1 BolA/IbaG family iron-sulfur metabolism protein [Pseudomonadales bacterium]MBK6584134.1 BolA/IbaG family iron-sulfur metabolism protein [Gammaproteobacteria bacterium]MBK7168616.1 BolA/IbaG family iron-sulfur metabolism protein [Gammaproteobacteria bacterium]MBK7520318.1 BolA/IbaG family iron-sulfur metabolism protein [Gammaproteobacteria bacterium]
MPTREIIETKLVAAFAPEHIEVLNESHRHNVPAGSETHFKVVLVSAAFEGRRSVQRHQQVYAALSEQLQGGVHALALHTCTPAEWRGQTGAPDSPDCMGGGKRTG